MVATGGGSCTFVFAVFDRCGDGDSEPALRASGHADQAAAVETQLRQSGAVADPRTYSLYLATRGESVETALRLAQAELVARGDVFTYDALAWAFAASSKLPEARLEIDRALSVIFATEHVCVG